MALITIHSAPSLDSFTSLADHQSQTPTTFFGSKPVLHYYSTIARALASRSRLSKLPFLDQIAGQEGSSEVVGPDVVEVVEVFVSSENFTLFNPKTAVGLSILYPAISLHAIQRLDDPSDCAKQVQGLYMNLRLTDPNVESEEDEDMNVIELTLIPSPSTSDSGTSAIQTLFEAVSNCSNLHPDPGFQGDTEMGDGEGDSRIVFEGSVGYEGISGLPGVVQGSASGGLPPPFPGSSGWITAENVSEYFDTDGNWINEGSEGPTLGEGAGRIRTRDEVEDGDINGQKEPDCEDNKRARTD